MQLSFASESSGRLSPLCLRTVKADRRCRGASERGKYDREHADQISCLDMISPALWAGVAVFYQGWAKRPDDAEKWGIAEMRRGLAIERESRSIVRLSSLEAALAEAEASAGETDAGLGRLPIRKHGIS